MGEDRDVAPLAQARSDALARLSERLGDPLLFSFLIVFVIREWQFLYVLATGVGEPLTAIARANAIFSWWRVLFDGLLAALYVVAWPFVHRKIVTYLARQKVATENALANEDLGRHMTLRALGHHPEYVSTRDDLSQVSRVFATTVGLGLGAHGDCGVGLQGHEGIVVPGLARLIAHGSALPELLPLAAPAPPNKPSSVVYVLKAFPTPKRRTFLLFAQNDVLLSFHPAPALEDAVLLAWRDDRWVDASHEGPPPRSLVAAKKQGAENHWQLVLKG